MMQELRDELVRALADHGFVEVEAPRRTIPDADLLLKRQTFNTNRAVVIVCPPEVPSDFCRYVRQVRTRVARRCGFFPLFWGIGVQVVVVAPGLAASAIDPKKHVARFDNQWAIVQSVFLVDPVAGAYRAARTWGQAITGKFQDAIEAVLGRHFTKG